MSIVLAELLSKSEMKTREDARRREKTRGCEKTREDARRRERMREDARRRERTREEAKMPEDTKAREEDRKTEDVKTRRRVAGHKAGRENHTECSDSSWLAAVKIVKPPHLDLPV